jgi:hypothetical protein
LGSLNLGCYEAVVGYWSFQSFLASFKLIVLGSDKNRFQDYAAGVKVYSIESAKVISQNSIGYNNKQHHRFMETYNLKKE